MSLAAATAVKSPGRASRSRQQRAPSSTVYLVAYAIRSSSTVRPCVAMPSRNPRRRLMPGGGLLRARDVGDPGVAEPARWVTAIRAPCSLSTETEGKL